MLKQYVKGKFTMWLLVASLALLPGCPGENDAGGVVDRVTPPVELTRLGDFAIGLAEMKREENTTSLYFAITKVTDTDAGSQSLEVILVDPHEREYSGQLDIDLNLRRDDSGFALNALPRGFTYTEVVEIRIPKIAPIQTIRLGEREIAFEQVKFGEPRFLEDFGRLAVAKGEGVPVGKWLYLAIKESGAADNKVFARVTVENRDFIVHDAGVKIGAQHEDGTISWGEPESISVPGLSEASEFLPFPVSIWKGEEIPRPRMLLLIYTDEATKERVLKAYALVPGQLPFVELKWSFETGKSVHSSPATAADGTIYVGSVDNRLYALNPDGSLKWSFETGGVVSSSPAIAADGTIYVGSWDNRLYAINPDGSRKWSFETGKFVTSSPAIAADGTIYVGSRDNRLYALNPDGSLKWSFETGGVVHSSPATAADGTIYVGSGDNRLYAVNPDGSLKWSFETGKFVTSSPAIAADGTIYVGSRDNRLYALNPDGSRKWSFETGGVVSSSPAIAPDGTIYVGSWDNRLYAFWEDNGGLADSPWPMFGQNPQRTGR